MFAVIGKKIVEKLNSSSDFNTANGSDKPELITNNTFVNTLGWAAVNGSIRASGGVLILERPTDISNTNNPTTYFQTSALTNGKKYLCNITYTTYHKDVIANISHQSVNGNDIYDGVTLPKGPNRKVAFEFEGTGTFVYFNFQIESEDFGAQVLASIDEISIKEVGDKKVFPVIIPQEVGYPAVTYEITNVTNFMSKGSSLKSCNVSIRLSCFADSYGTTYNQAKAIVEALDLYSVTYTEDGQSYTAKFRFIDLDDEYFKNAEKFYKNIIFDCLIIKN